MKKIFTQLLMLIACVAVSFTAQARLINLGDIELDTDYNIPMDFNAYIASYTATSSGTLIASSTDTYTLLPYYQKLSDMESEGNAIHYTLDNPYGAKQYHFDVTEGTTYYFYIDFTMSSFTFRISMDAGEGLSITETTPKAGSTFSISGSGLVSVKFNRSVRLNNTAQIISGEHTATVGVNGENNIFSMEIKEPLFKWLNDGTLNGGDTFIVRLTNVTASDDASIVYGTDGTVDIEYTIGNMPIQLINSENTTGTFKSYYLSNDPTGIVTLTFDGDVASAYANLTYGSIDVEGDYYTEVLTPIIEGNTIKVDLTGKTRTPDSMVASGNNYNNVTLSISKVMDTEGQHAYSPQDGSIGGFSFTYDALEVVTAEVISEFTPASGTTIEQNLENIEIWVTDEAKLSYDGIRFAADFWDEPIIVCNFIKEADTFDATAAILTVPFPWEYIPMYTEGAEENTPYTITVTLNNLQSADGIDHSADVTATYYLNGLNAVDKIFGEETSTFTVYNTKGILVMHTSNRDELQNLPKGIYIINGKKFLVTR